MSSLFIPSVPIRTSSRANVKKASLPHGQNTPRCELDPSKPVEPSRQLSATDLQYLAKIRRKFFDAQRAAHAASHSDYASAFADEDDVAANSALASAAGRGSGRRGAMDDGDLAATLPDDFDAMEDILFDRAPVNQGQVKMFGGWLDEGVAGRKAKDPSVASAGADKDEDAVAAERATDAHDEFSRAMQLFNQGDYRGAEGGYARAVQMVGGESRAGGQYQLWWAQAVDAMGDKGRAAGLLQALGAHADGEVRKVSRELLFILTAPRLQLDASNFVDIPEFDEGSRSAVPLMSNFGPLRTALVEKQPEPYSLEWYVKKERPPKVGADTSMSQAVAVAAAIVGTLTYMMVGPHY